MTSVPDRLHMADAVMKTMEQYAANLEDTVDDQSQQPVSDKQKTNRLLYRLLSVLVRTAGVRLVCTLVSTATTHPRYHLKDQGHIARSLSVRTVHENVQKVPRD